MGLRQIAVQNEEGDLAVALVVGTGDIQMRNLIQSGDIIRGRLHQQIQHCAAGKLQRPTVWIVDRLPEHAVGVRHNWSDDVDQLGQAGELYSIRIAQQRINESPDQKRIFQVVDFFQQVRCFLFVTVDRISGRGAIPNIPFIKGEP